MYMWPNARISVMGGEQAATVLSMVAAKGKTVSNHVNLCIQVTEEAASEACDRDSNVKLNLIV